MPVLIKCFFGPAKAPFGKEEVPPVGRPSPANSGRQSLSGKRLSRPTGVACRRTATRVSPEGVFTRSSVLPMRLINRGGQQSNQTIQTANKVSWVKGSVWFFYGSLHVVMCASGSAGRRGPCCRRRCSSGAAVAAVAAVAVIAGIRWQAGVVLGDALPMLLLS